MRKQKHRYEIYELKHGFKVVPRETNRPIVTCKLNKDGFWGFWEGKTPFGWCSYNIPLYFFYYILDTTVEVLYRSWYPEENNSKGNAIKEQIIIKYCKTTTAKTLNKKIHEIWKRKCESIDPSVREFHRKLYSVSKGTGNWDAVRKILENKKKYKYLIDDALKYKAARIAILHSYDSNIEKDWKMCFAKNNELYTSLTKTLMNLPDGVVFHHVLRLKEMKLPEPATTRIRLWAYSVLARQHNIGHWSREVLANVIMRSSDDDIKNAIRYMWKYFSYGDKKDDFRRTKSITLALGMIFDYPMLIGKWNLLGLAKRSEKYHHDLEMQERIRRMEWEKANQILLESQTALPPIPLPENDNVKFLDTYKSVYNEGEIMGHCIAQYAKGAVMGDSYLFHIEYKEEKASVEISPWGHVVQAYGPKDTRNEASKYGEKILRTWGKPLTENYKKPVLRAEIDNIHYIMNNNNIDIPF